MSDTSPAGAAPRAALPAAIISVVLVVVGLVLGATVSMGFMALFGLGAVGPALLREVGILRDQDEFQRQASLRAGLRAYLIGGAFLTIVIAVKQWHHANLDHDAYSASGVLAVLVVSYFLGSVTSFWGARNAAFRILLAFGTFWLVFVLLSHEGVADLIEAALAMPFFALAFASRRWPRVSGVLVLAAGVGATMLFRLDRMFSASDNSSLFVFVVFVLPLVFCGWTLLSHQAESPGHDVADPPPLDSPPEVP